MARQIVSQAGRVRMLAALNETATATAIWEALPIEARGNTWGDEIYFGIPVDLATERGQEAVERGDLGFWEPGSAFCIFFGPTPMSRGDEIRPASPVTVVGRCLDDSTLFKSVRSGEAVRIERAPADG